MNAFILIEIEWFRGGVGWIGAERSGAERVGLKEGGING